MRRVRLDGLDYKHAVIAGSQRVIKMQEHLNGINVFPVADADTGTNMALTLRHVADGVRDNEEGSLHEISKTIANVALMSARGSSGAILAQFFQGLSEGLTGKTSAKAADFARAAVHAASVARDATADPQEGTILTVMQDWAQYLHESGGTAPDLPALIDGSLKVASESLRNTPSKLETLRRAGVVDAGGQGFVYMLEGAMAYIRSGEIEWAAPRELPSIAAEAPVDVYGEIPFRYCTQATVTDMRSDRRALMEELRALGDSLIVAGSKERVHVHIHTNDPEKIFAIAGAHGVVAQARKEDMQIQHDRAHHQAKIPAAALITDSSCDLPESEFIEHNIRVIPHTVTFGDDSYVDDAALRQKGFYRLLESSPHFPKTSHAAPGDFRGAFLQTAEIHREAVVIMLSGAISGALQQAIQSAHAVQDQIDISVFDSKNTSIGLGLIVREAADAIESGASLAEVRERLDWAIRNVRIFVTVETIEFLIRGGRVSKLRGVVANAMHLKPILTMSAEGEGKVVAKTFGGEMGRRRVLRLVRREATGKRNLRFLVAHASAPETANYYARRVRESFVTGDVPVVPMSPAFGAHLGPGATAIAFLGE